MKHGKQIVEQQFLLNRLANSAMDLYASLVVLSRASRSLSLNLPSCTHEEKIARVWVNEVGTGVCMCVLRCLYEVRPSVEVHEACVNVYVCVHGCQ